MKSKKNKQIIKKSEKKKNKTNIKVIIFRVIACVLFFAFCLVPPIFINNIFGYLPILSCILVLLISFIYLLILKRSIVFSENASFDNCIRNSDIDFVITITNKSLLVFPKISALFYISDLFGNIDSTTKHDFTLSPKEKRDFHFNVKFEHIGNYTTGLKELVIYDPTNIFHKTLSNSQKYDITIIPKLFDFTNLTISNQVEIESQKSKIATAFDGMDYTGVREYVFGDPIKNIHWKLSSHSTTYLTKLLETYGNSNISIIMDFVSPEYDNETLMSIFDSIVETSLSLARYSRDVGVDYSIVYNSKNNEKKKVTMYSFDEMDELIDELQKITTDTKNSPAPEYLREEVTSLYGAGNVAYCTASITQEIVETLISIKLKRRNPILFVIVPKKMDIEEQKAFLKPVRALEEYAIPFYVISDTEDFSKEVNA